MRAPGLRGPLLRTIQRALPVSDRLDGQRFLTRDAATGRRAATPLLLALVVVECMDLLFAADSIPAIFAITRDTFLVYTSNIFAIAGLRSLYFLLADAVQRFRYLHYGLAVILTFVGLNDPVGCVHRSDGRVPGRRGRGDDGVHRAVGSRSGRRTGGRGGWRATSAGPLVRTNPRRRVAL